MKDWFNILIHKFASIFLDMIVSQKCAGCKKEREIFCQNCAIISYKYGASCVFCNFRNRNGHICQKCKIDYSPSFYQSLWSGKYVNFLKNSIKELKYRGRKELAKPLAKLMYKKFLEFYPNFKKENFILVPIPMHPKKEYLRGFNQSELLAEEFSKLADIIIMTKMLLKKTDTKNQVEIKTKQERIKNLENAFSVKWQASSVNNKTIILMDDVTTTGATFLHSSYALNQAGAIKIICLAVAHGH